MLKLQPHMDEDALVFFKERIKSSLCYLEYGAGGSTFYAVNVVKVPVVISVESDRSLIEQLAPTLLLVNSRVFISHCNIGKIEAWGYPKNIDNVLNYWSYMSKPWHVVRENDFSPDLILIDGRFRVASFLYSLLSAKEGTTILFDDYADREEYFLVEKFCPLQERKGNMGVFTVSKDFSVPDICEKIAQYSIIWD